MKKLLFSILFILIFSSFSFAQESIPAITLADTPQTVVVNQVRLGRLIIEPNYQDYSKTQVTIFGVIGTERTDLPVDPYNNTYKVDILKDFLVYQGDVSKLLEVITLVDSAESAALFKADFNKLFYDPATAKGLAVMFNNLVQLLQSKGVLVINSEVKKSN